MATSTLWTFDTPAGAEEAARQRKAKERFQGPSLVQSNLSADQEAKLRETFADES